MVESADGQTVYDTTLHVTWLANANFTASEKFQVIGVNQSGSMTYAAAVKWVTALNARGYLGHNNWQLPTTPHRDRTCAHTGRHGESFGFGCSGSALGSLYHNSLRLREPDTAVAIPENKVGPFHNFQPYLYWSGSAALDPKQGFVSFSFNSGFQGANVPLNYLHVLPMIEGKLPGTPPATGKGLQVNPGGETVYDPVADVTWFADADLAAKNTFGVAEINADGSMKHTTAVRWVNAMNKDDHGRGYLGRTGWKLPDTRLADQTCSIGSRSGFGCKGSAMGALFYDQLGFRRGDSVVPAPDVKVGPSGPFAGFQWNFSLGNGFQGTNLLGNELYDVMVYYPDAPRCLVLGRAKAS